jgi:phytoene synthase
MQESRRITRKSASNLALAFVLLPRAKREGMSALYAFCREVDDVADEDTAPVDDRRRRLEEWRTDVRRTFSGDRPRFPVNQELQHIIARYPLRLEHFEELLLGVEMDLDIRRYENNEQLDLYCYRVASVVGLLSIEIFGYRDPRCRDYAVSLGKALQLTNILRDVGSDAARGRIYLPLAELARFQVKEQEIFRGEYSQRFAALAASTGDRARSFYRMARQSLPEVDRRGMAAAELMGAVYWRLLQKLERRRFAVLGGSPTRLGKPRKVCLILGTWLRLATGLKAPNYGG